MGNTHKLFEKAKKSPNNFLFNEACALAEGVGFVLRRKKSGSSHHIYKHPGVPYIMNLQPVGKKAKPYQVKQLVGYIEDYDLLEE
jgi:hypothetical protein